MVKTRKTFKCNLTIDGEKLLKEIEKRGLTKGEVAAEVGKSSSYINTCVADRSIAPPVMKLLDLLYNIKHEDIKPDSTGGVKTEQLPGQLVWTWTSSGRLSIKSVEEL